MKVLIGSSNSDLGAKILVYSRLQKVESYINRFPDGESNVIISDSNLRHNDEVTVFQSLYRDQDVMELLLIVDALIRRGIHKIHLLLSYCCYTRADRIVAAGSAIGAKVIADIIGSKVTSISILDVHFSQFEGFFDISFSNILPFEILQSSFEFNENTLLVAPDLGAAKKLRAFSEQLKVGIVIMNKHRPMPGACEITDIIGECAGKECIIVDDIVCGGGTLCNAATALREMGAISVKAFVTHGVLSGDAYSRIDSSDLEGIVITDSIPGRVSKNKVSVVSAGSLLAKQIGC